jgi:tetratricopeptide (TPR) repeat protein
MEKPKPNKGKSPPAKPAAKSAAAPVPAPVKLPPLFRRIDWLVLIVSFAAVWAAYLITLAPDLTLEDSGELCTASFYAGIPHPPGYPFWSIYSWFWTAILPMGSVTWRVEVGESFAAAMACGLVGLMVSRGSSMLIEGIEELKDMNRKWEGAICVVCGITAGLLLGFDNFMWKESVAINRISLFDVPWLMVVAVCLMRWIYAPHQRRYLYIAMFFFGLCITIHQTMLVAAMGIEVAVAMTVPRLGRDFFFWNGVIYVLGVFGMNSGKLPALAGLDPVFIAIFHVVGIGSIAACVWLTAKTKALGTETKVVILALVFWFIGVAFYFYEPLSGMTDPPMQWGYPRTVEGFFHALTRGQYEQAHPTDILHEKVRFLMQLGMLVSGLANSFSWGNLFLALMPFLFILKMQKRERAWIVCLAAIYICVGILLTVVMNTTPDRQSAEENKVFFTASHALVAIMIGYGLALLSAYMATHYRSFRFAGLMLGAITLLPALVVLYDGVGTTFYGGVGLMTYQYTLFLFLSMVAAFVLAAMAAHWFIKNSKSSPDDSFLGWMFGGAALLFVGLSMYFAFSGEDRLGLQQVVQALPRIFVAHQYSLPVWGALLNLGIVVAFIGGLVIYRNRAPVLITLCLISVMPVYSGLTHWAKGEERNHWFGYWFGHDMFTPPFVGPDGKFSYDAKLREQMMKGPNGNLVYPEMDRNTILFGGTDPGRFCPTYMIFCESFVPPKDKKMDPNFDRRDVYLITQNALADGTYLDYLRAQYFRSAQFDPPFFRDFLALYWWAFFFPALGLCALWIVMDFVRVNPRRNRTAIIIGSVWVVIFGVIFFQVLFRRAEGFVDGISKAAYSILDVPLTQFGKHVEDRRRAQGVYPPKEIYIPSPEDSEKSFHDYTLDVQQRQMEGRIQPGEDVQVDPASGRVSVSGQVAVMMINGLLCRVIFDHNPTNAFYVEESFPLEWMYPYETPFGIIMKINRDPITALPDDVYKRDHAFWSKYSERLIGNWITYDTSVQQIADWVEKVYLRNDYSGFTGDRKFIRDDDAQKAFSKLRSSQAGVYAWRLHLLYPSPPPDPQYLPYRPKSDAEVEQLERECDFAFKQSFAFCPYSPEAVVRYANFLFQFQRFDDALIVAKTCQKLDPYNGQITGLIDQINQIKQQIAEQTTSNAQASTQLQQMENEARAHPTNVQNLLVLGGAYLQMQRTNDAIALFDQALNNPAISYNEIASLAQLYSKLGYGYLDKLEAALQKLVPLAPEPIQPEAYYDLAAIKAVQGKSSEALDNLRTAMNLNAKRLQANPNASDLASTNRSDTRFDALRSLPEFQKIVPPK